MDNIIAEYKENEFDTLNRKMEKDKILTAISVVVGFLLGLIFGAMFLISSELIGIILLTVFVLSLVLIKLIFMFRKL